jgi:hypothetical protein
MNELRCLYEVRFQTNNPADIYNFKENHGLTEEDIEVPILQSGGVCRARVLSAVPLSKEVIENSDFFNLSCISVELLHSPLLDEKH